MKNREHSIFHWTSIIFPIILLCTIYLQNRTLFLDSLNLARNIGELSFIDLTKPLLYHQTSPVLFLWLSKLSSLIFGMNEYALRVIPLIASIGSLFLLSRVSRQFLTKPWRHIAVFWFGTHSLFLRYGTEFKQYMTDVLATLIILWLVDRYGKITSKNRIPVLLIGSLMIWFSMPAVFLLGGYILFSLVENYRTKKSLWPTVMVAFGLLLNFIGEYSWIMKPVMESSQMQDFHESFFMKGELTTASLIHNFKLILSYLRMIVGKTTIALVSASIMLIIGLWSAYQQKQTKAIVLVFPISAMFFAALLGKYSIIERLMLFSMPLTMIILLMGLSYIFTKRINQKIVGTILSCCLLVGFTHKQGIKYLWAPLDIEDNKTPLTFIANHPDRFRTIICSPNAYPAFDYYVNKKKDFKVDSLGLGVITYPKTDFIGVIKIQVIKEGAIWYFVAHENIANIERIKQKISVDNKIVTSYHANQSAAILIKGK